MPDTPKNVMPFEQDAGFFARRALKKQKDGRFQEAVMLLRVFRLLSETEGLR